MKKAILIFYCSFAILSCKDDKYPDGWRSNSSNDWYIEKLDGIFFLKSNNDPSIKNKWPFDNRKIRFEGEFMKIKSQNLTGLLNLQGEIMLPPNASSINGIEKLELGISENLNLIKYFSKNWEVEDDYNYQSSHIYHIDGDSLDYLSTKNKILFKAKQIEFNDWTFDIIDSIAKNPSALGLSLSLNPKYSEHQRISTRKYYKVELPDGNIGVIDIFQNIVIPFEYDEIRILKKELFVVRRGLKWGMFEKSNLIIPLEYDKFRYDVYQILNQTWDLESDRFIIGAEKEDSDLGVWGAINIKNQKIVIPFVYRELCPINDCSFFILDNESWKIIDVGNKIILDTKASIDDAQDCYELRNWLYKINANRNSNYENEKKKVFNCSN